MNIYYFTDLFLYPIYTIIISMSNSLRIMSYNCYGLKSSLVDLYALCEQFDIIFLQETLLFGYELPLLCDIHPDFEGMGISAIDDTV